MDARVSLPWDVLRLQYKAIRFPLTLLGRLVMRAFDTDAPCRLTYQEMLESIDGTEMGPADNVLRSSTTHCTPPVDFSRHHGQDRIPKGRSPSRVSLATVASGLARSAPRTWSTTSH